MPTSRARQAAEVYGAFVRKLITWLTMRTVGRRAVRHRHRAAAERQFRPAGHVDRVVRELPDRARQQHRVDLGAPGADARALVRRARAGWRRASRRCAAPCSPRRATRRRCSPKCMAMREKVRQRASGEGRSLRRQAQPGRHDRRRVRGAVPRAGRQRASHPELLDNVGNIALLRRAEACGAAAGRASARRRPTRTATCAARSTGRGSTSSRRRSSPALLGEQRDAVLALWHAVFGLTAAALDRGAAVRGARRRGGSRWPRARRTGARPGTRTTRSTGSRHWPLREPWRALERRGRALQRAAPGRQPGRRAAGRRARLRRRVPCPRRAAWAASPGR